MNWMTEILMRTCHDCNEDKLSLRLMISFSLKMDSSHIILWGLKIGSRCKRSVRWGVPELLFHFFCLCLAFCLLLEFWSNWDMGMTSLDRWQALTADIALTVDQPGLLTSLDLRHPWISRLLSTIYIYIYKYVCVDTYIPAPGAEVFRTSSRMDGFLYVLDFLWCACGLRASFIEGRVTIIRVGVSTIRMWFESFLKCQWPKLLKLLLFSRHWRASDSLQCRGSRSCTRPLQTPSFRFARLRTI